MLFTFKIFRDTFLQFTTEGYLNMLQEVKNFEKMGKHTTIPIKVEKLDQLHHHIQQFEIQDWQRSLQNFLKIVEKMMKEKAVLHLPKTLDKALRLEITRPRVFLSYAWEDEGTAKLTYLQCFLKQLASDLDAAGLEPWLDILNMRGHVEQQMRAGINSSQYVLLIGTNRYSARTKLGSETNVRKELDFALKQAKIKKSSDFFLPLLFEGEYKTTFIKEINENIVRKCGKWYSLEQGQWKSLMDYIKDLTQFEPLGIIPVLIGLKRDDFPEYRKACLDAYKQAQVAFMNSLELKQLNSPLIENKRDQSQIMSTPKSQIPLSIPLFSDPSLFQDKDEKKLSSSPKREILSDLNLQARDSKITSIGSEQNLGIQEILPIISCGLERDLRMRNIELEEEKNRRDSLLRYHQQLKSDQKYVPALFMMGAIFFALCATFNDPMASDSPFIVFCTVCIFVAACLPIYKLNIIDRTNLPMINFINETNSSSLLQNHYTRESSSPSVPLTAACRMRFSTSSTASSSNSNSNNNSLSLNQWNQK